MVCGGLLLLTEGFLRVTGRGPWRPFAALLDVPTVSAPDAELGWVNHAGVHAWPAGGTTTIDPAGVRAPGRQSGHRVVLLGGSFLFGFGLDDADVVSTGLEALRPDLQVENRSVPGYGTLQSLLLAERLDLHDTTVVYGFLELHEGRNAAVPSWLRALDRSPGAQGWARTPRASWDGEQLVFEPPVGRTHWWSSEHVALVDAGERAWVGLLDRLHRTKAETTVRLVERLDERVAAQGGRFLVALIDVPTRRSFYTHRFAELTTVDLPVGATLPDGHPDASTHARWAEQLAEVL